MDFAHFWTAYEDIVSKARGSKLTVEDFQGTTISLTNPGTIGTVHSVPRLMQGQGTIIGVGALDYPAEWQGASNETLNRNAVSKILTLTCDLRPPHHPGRPVRRLPADRPPAAPRRATASTTRSSSRLRIPYEPIRWIQDVDTSHDDDINKVARVQELIHAYRVRGHLMADTDPLEYKQRRHHDLDVTTHGLTLWDLDRTFATGGFGGQPFLKLRKILGILRDSYCRTVGIEYMHIQDPEQREWIQDKVEVGYAKTDARRAAAHPAPAQRRRGLRDLPADQVRRAEALLARGRRVGHRRCSTASCAAPPSDEPRRGRASACRTAVGSTCSPTSRASPTARSSASSRASRTPKSVQGSGDVKYHLGTEGKFVAEDGSKTKVYLAANPSPPRGRQPGARGHRPRQAGPPQPRRRGLHRAARAPARRRGVRRPGRRGRDAQPLAAARLPHRRHDPRRHQQPGRLHDLAEQLALARRTPPTSPR